LPTPYVTVCCRRFFFSWRGFGLFPLFWLIRKIRLFLFFDVTAFRITKLAHRTTTPIALLPLIRRGRSTLRHGRQRTGIFDGMIGIAAA
jgi:hypothetical protein